MKTLVARLPLWILFLLIGSCEKEMPALPGEKEEENPSTYTQYGQPFAAMPATADIVMYEVNLRAFSPEGSLQGVIQRLDELKKLGVNVIWLMPIHPIGSVRSVNSPYSVRDYKAVSPEYGSLADLRQLTDQAHSRGMAVILDWVANHTSWDNPWIKNRGWYTQDAAGNIVHPPGTNWQDVADLNFAHTEMRLAMIDAMKYWILEANVDGYRFDYADGVPFDFWEQALDSLERIPGRELTLLAEGNREDHYRAGFDLTYGWDFYGALKAVFNGQPVAQLVNVHEQEYRGLPAGAHKLRFTTNHDESAWDQTPIVLFNGQQGALAASVIAVYMGGVPLLYTGQEVGRAATVPFFSKSPIDWTANPGMLRAYQAMLEVYTASPAARRGANTFYPHADVLAMKKTFENEELIILVNTRNRPVDYMVPAALSGWVGADALSQQRVHLVGTLELDGYDYLILRR